MTESHLQFRATAPQHDFLRRVAYQRDVSDVQVLRELVDREMRRLAAPKTPNRADEALVARLQRILVPEMASALSWDDLAARLLARGVEPRAAGGGLALHDARSGARLCKSSELGFAYGQLVSKFRMPMPGHPHRMAHVLLPSRPRAPPAYEGSAVIE